MQNPTGAPYPEVAHARRLLTRLLTTAGPGGHCLTYGAVTVTGDTLTAHAHARVWRFGPFAAVLTDRAGIDELSAALAIGLEGSSVRYGGMVMRSGKTIGPTVRAWSVEDGWIRPLSRDEVMRMYATDPDTGGTMPLDPFVTYAAGIPLPRPTSDRRTT